ncbi:oxidoreductase [Bacteroidia bacterium]|nr:oxidoreductase [Bacteroidia bacterium]
MKEMNMTPPMTRRQFLALTTAAAVGATVGTFPLEAAQRKKLLVPKRVLGRTGVEVPLLGFGTGSLFNKAFQNRDDEAVQLLHRAADLGITWFDTAHIYGNGGWSESIVGQVLKTRRKEIFVTTKIRGNTYDEIMRQLELSLKRLQTDYIDLLHVHWLRPDEVDVLGEKGHSVETYYKLREQKVVRFIGVSSHDNPIPVTRFIERYDFDCVQVALNAAMQGVVIPQGATGPAWRLAPEIPPSFETITLPVAQKKNMGIIGMKVLAYGHLIGNAPDKADVQTLLRYAWSLPITSTIVGMTSLADVEQNAAWASAFQAMSPDEMRELSNRISSANKVAIDKYFANHSDMC